MDAEKFIFRTGMALTAGIVAGAMAWDLSSEFKAQADIKAVNVSPDIRVKQCGDENSQCNTSHAVLNECLLRKAGKIHSEIQTIIENRNDVKISARSFMTFGLAYLGFLGYMSKTSQSTRKSPAPRPE